MEFLILGFFTGLSLILAFGAQNIFVMEQGLKKQFIFIVCLICSISDFLLIFLGIFLFESFKIYFNNLVESILNILLFIFLIYFIFSKIKTNYSNYNLNTSISEISFKSVIIKTLGFTYLNPHVYSDTVFFLGNFSKNFELNDKILFGLGASSSSFIFFFALGYLSKLLSKYLMNIKTQKVINLFIILFMSSLAIYVLREILRFYI
tara:strand:- start:31 stop:648 length:618 start_codon:yes stop_codon:yes gene_type:complete